MYVTLNVSCEATGRGFGSIDLKFGTHHPSTLREKMKFFVKNASIVKNGAVCLNLIFTINVQKF